MRKANKTVAMTVAAALAGTALSPIAPTVAKAQVLPVPPGPPGPSGAKSPSGGGGGKGSGGDAAVAGYFLASNGCFTLVTAGQAIYLGKGPKAKRRETTPAEAGQNLLSCLNIAVVFYARYIGKDNTCSLNHARRAYQENNTPLAIEQRTWGRDGSDSMYRLRQQEQVKVYWSCYSQKVTVTHGKKYKKKKKTKKA